MNKKKKKILIATGLSTLFFVGAVCGGIKLLNESNLEFNLFDKIDNLSVDKFKGNIELKLLNTTESEDGTITKSFEYEILPSTAQLQQVDLSLSFQDGTDCSDVVVGRVINSTKTIDIMCKGAFDKVVILKLTATNYKDVYTTAEINYVKKLNYVISIQRENEKFLRYGNEYCEHDYFDNSLTFSKITLDDLIVPHYSKYTLDYDYSLAVQNLSVSFNNFYCEEDVGYEWNYESVVYKVFNNELQNAILEWVTNGVEITSSDIYNLSSNTEWQQYLHLIDKDKTSHNTIMYGLTYDVVNTATNEIVESFYGENLAITLDRDYSSFEIPISNLKLELNSIDF